MISYFDKKYPSYGWFQKKKKTIKKKSLRGLPIIAVCLGFTIQPRNYIHIIITIRFLLSEYSAHKTYAQTYTDALVTMYVYYPLWMLQYYFDYVARAGVCVCVVGRFVCVPYTTALGCSNVVETAGSYAHSIATAYHRAV